MSRHEIQVLRAAAMGQAAVAAKTRLESYGREIIPQLRTPGGHPA